MTVRLENVSFTYPGTQIGVLDVNLTVPRGELVAIIGASGSGKTTLLNLVAGFLIPTAGRIYLDDEDVTQLPPRTRNLGMVFQSYALFPHLSVVDNVAYPLKVRGMANTERRKLAHAMLQRVGLADFALRKPGSLSGGQQQRVALARALVFEPQALLLDEPLSALDAALRVDMRDQIRGLQQQQGIATLHITHDQEEALSIADRVGVIERGQLVQLDTPRNLYDRPLTRSIAAFVGHANLWDGEVTGPETVRVSFGTLRSGPHGRSVGERCVVLVRPECVALGHGDGGENSFDCRITRDRFFGAIRRYDAIIGDQGTLLGETGERGDITAVHIPARHVQLLPGA
jgi:putative spermidine/putrescine transport system ATP-binding protein